MYGCESWTIKKAEHQSIYAFELWCWRRLLRVFSARRSNQSILKESVLNIHWNEWCWSWNSNTLATWCEELTHWKRPWCWHGLRAGGEGDEREWDGWMASPTRWTWVWVNSRSWWWTGRPGMLRFMGFQSRTQLSNWPEQTLTQRQTPEQNYQCYLAGKRIYLCFETNLVSHLMLPPAALGTPERLHSTGTSC